MKAVVVTDVPLADPSSIDAPGSHGVATVHEAMGRTGLVGASLRPIQEGIRIAGSAATVLCWPGDNLMIHAAVEQCRDGDVLVVTTVSTSLDGSFGELFATALQHRGVRGLVTTGGVRDVADLRAMGFPVRSAAVHAQGTVKATAGSINVPITVGGAAVCAGDVIQGRVLPASDLPEDRGECDDVLLDHGHPDPRQIDGLGAAHPLTSKVAVISPSADDGTDVHYLFLQFGVDEAFITDRQNCDNLLARVGPSAVERGLVPAGYGHTEVRIRCSTRRGDVRGQRHAQRASPGPGRPSVSSTRPATSTSM